MHKKCRGLITTVFIFAIKTAVGCGENQLTIEKSMNTSIQCMGFIFHCTITNAGFTHYFNTSTWNKKKKNKMCL